MASAPMPGPKQPGVELLTEADDKPLNFCLIDSLSKKLGQDWKRFARGTDLFTEAQIENISAEERTNYDKCFKMIKTWQELSIAQVTIAMAKLNVISLGRNDLLLDIFNSAPLRSAATGGPASMPVTGFSEPNVSDLQYKHIKKLSSFLDPDHGIGIRNWLHLGNAIFQGDKDSMEQTENLHLSYAGGGSPASVFLKNVGMRFPTFTVKEFIDISKKCQRRDITNLVEGFNAQPHIPFRMLSFAQHEKIARLLDKSIRGVSDWRSFADSMGFTNEEISSFKLALKEKDQYSPTHGLIDLMKQRYPLLNLTKIRKAASSIGRNDVAQYLDTVIVEITTLKSNP